MTTNGKQKVSVSKVITHNNNDEIIESFTIEGLHIQFSGISFEDAYFIHKKLGELLQEGGVV